MIRAELMEIERLDREIGRAKVMELVWFWVAMILVFVDVLRIFAS